MSAVVDVLARTALGPAERVLSTAHAALGDAARTARFLRGRAEFAARRGDVYVASYPRSGTTWSLAIAHLLVSGAEQLDFAHISDVAPWWERTLAYQTEGAKALDAFPGRRVFKTHLPRCWLPRAGKQLYLWRNPEDVAVSYFHLYRRYLRFEGTFAEFFERFVQGDLQYRSWFRHVRGWRAHAGAPNVLLVPYDALRAEPARWIARMAGFLELEANAARIERIVRETDFAHMKAAQGKFDHLGELSRQWGIREGEFIREGKVAHGEGVLTEAQRDALAKAGDRPIRFPTLEWRLPSFLH